MKRCLQKAPEARPSAKEAFETLHYLLNTPRMDPRRHSTESGTSTLTILKSPMRIDRCAFSLLDRPKWTGDHLADIEEHTQDAHETDSY